MFFEYFFGRPSCGEKIEIDRHQIPSYMPAITWDLQQKIIDQRCLSPLELSQAKESLRQAGLLEHFEYRIKRCE